MLHHHRIARHASPSVPGTQQCVQRPPLPQRCGPKLRMQRSAHAAPFFAASLPFQEQLGSGVIISPAQAAQLHAEAEERARQEVQRLEQQRREAEAEAAK